MNNNRELLELAAKAAGIEINVNKQRSRDDSGFGHIGLWTTTTTNWNPLTDDGDALRLAVKLGIQLHIEGREESRAVWANEVMLWTDGDDLAATRRAIVRAAAQLATTTNTENV